jgi:hypothetical protein
MAEQSAEENDHYDEGLGYRHQKQQKTNTEEDILHRFSEPLSFGITS